MINLIKFNIGTELVVSVAAHCGHQSSVEIRDPPTCNIRICVHVYYNILAIDFIDFVEINLFSHNIIIL